MAIHGKFIKQEQKQVALEVVKYYEQKILENGFELVGLEDVEWKVFSPFDKIFRKFREEKDLRRPTILKEMRSCFINFLKQRC